MKTILAIFTAAAVITCAMSSAAAATLSVTPNVISNDYAGIITLQIGGLDAGETVLVEQLSDFDGDGSPAGSDLTLATFPLVDGQVTTVGGVTNLHVPGDLNGSAGSITSELYMSTFGFQRKAVGKHLFRLSSPASRFPAVLAPFTITNTLSSSQVTGQVKSSGTNVPFALVVLFQPSGEDIQPVLAGASDATGNYSLRALPGGYMVAAFKPDYVADFSDPAIVALMPAATASTNVSLLPASRHISGRLVDDADSSRGLGGVLTIAESPSGQIAVGFTDRAGNYSIGVSPGLWQVGPDDGDLAGLGYVGLDEWPGADSTSGDAIVPLPVPRGTALLHGTVQTDTGVPLKGVALWAEDGSGGHSVTPRTDHQGRFFSSVPAGTWELGVSAQDNPAYGGYVFSHPLSNLSLTPGTALSRGFLAKAAPYTISGYLRDPNMAPLSGVQIWSMGQFLNLNYSAQTVTDDSGFFTLPAFNASWNVGAACDGEQGLRVRGFSCAAGNTVLVANANATLNLTATPCSGLQITTGSLPIGRVGDYYSLMLFAETCGEFLHWSLAPTSGPLPPGLSIMNSGLISGTPSQAGQFNFTVQVTDGSGTVTKPFTLTVEPSSPLSILSGDPVHATNGVAYAFTLQAHGGVPPYNWSLAPGSGPVPGGLDLSTTGQISGTPNQPGEFYFRVRLTDAAQASVEQTLRLMVNDVSTPVEIATKTLPNGIAGVPYTATLQVSGGKAPFYWHMALGSAPLPQGLTLVESTGQIHGTPAVAGTFQFIVQVQDSALLITADEQVLALTIQPSTPPVTGMPRLGSDGKFQFQIDGLEGMTYSVEKSTDLKTWTLLRSTNAPSNSFIFVADPPTGDHGYFRVRTGP